MKKKAVLVFLILLFCCTFPMVSQGNPWGNLKKIYFYTSMQDEKSVLERLDSIDLDEVKRSEQSDMTRRLIQFGDYFFSKGKIDTAEAFYKKVVDHAPRYWPVVNKLEKVKRSRGAGIIGLNNVFKQLLMTIGDFETFFMMMNGLLNILFFAGILSFFIFSLLLFRKYFRLAGNDILIVRKQKISIQGILFVFLAILWPLFAFSGWVVYPFLIIGFLWGYLNSNEKKSVSFALVVVVVITFLYSFNLVFEKNLQREDFKSIMKLNKGHLFDKEIYENFDDELKVMQAFGYYEDGNHDTALEILHSTDDNLKNILKYELLGNIYYRAGDIPLSIRYYKESLGLNEKNPVTLNNFTMALARNDNAKVFDSWAKRYPEIADLKNKELNLKEPREIPGVLWRRLFNLSGGKFIPSVFIKSTLVQVFKLPIIYCILILLIYIFMIGKIWPSLGESTHCSKCARIIKKTAIHKSYKLCDECHQLFLIKDVIFLEAKVLKEKELRKRYRKKFMMTLLLSLIIPGLNLKYREKDKLFMTLNFLVYVLIGFAVLGFLVFEKVYMTTPLFFNVLAGVAMLFYFLVNMFSVLGEDDGI